MYLLIYLVHLFLLIFLGIKNSTGINPDAIAYMRISEYYLTGNLDLAINSYWGPFFSWVIAPFIGMGFSPLLAARIAMGISAMIFLAGAHSMFRVMLSRETDRILATFVTAIVAAFWSVPSIISDLLMHGLLMLGLADMLSAQFNRVSPHYNEFRSGALFGLSVLTKSAALPISLGLIISYYFVQASFGLGSKLEAFKSISRNICFLIIIVFAWVFTLSWHYGELRFSSSATINHRLKGPTAFSKDHPYTRMFIVPAPGRITTWEDPEEKYYEKWSPVDNLDNFKHQIRIIKDNFYTIAFLKLPSFSLFGLGLIATIFYLLIPSKTQTEKINKLMCSIITIIVSGIYLPVYAESQRYYLICFPIFIVSTLNLYLYIKDKTPKLKKLNSYSTIALLFPPKLLPREIFKSIIIIIIFIGPIIPTLWNLSIANKNYVWGLSEKFEKLLRNAPPGPIASLSLGRKKDKAIQVALYGAFLSNRQFFGNIEILDNINQLNAVNGGYIVVDQDSSLYEDMKKSSAKYFATLTAPQGKVIEIFKLEGL